MANQKILTLGFKINIDATGKAKLDKLTEGVEKGLDSANAKTKSLTALEAKRATLIGELASSQIKLEASITKQNEAISKNSGFYKLAETNLTRMVEKHNQISDSIQKEVSATIQLINATKTYDSLVGDIKNKTRDDVGTVARQAKLLEERKAREKKIIEDFNSATKRIEDEAAAVRKEKIDFLSAMENRKTVEIAELAKFHIEANANLEKVQTKSVINEKIALYNSLYDKIDARARESRATETIRPTGNFNYATGATTAAKQTEITPIKPVPAEVIKSHTNLFLRVGEAIGAYRIWNTVLTSVQAALIAIPKAGIEQQQALSSIYAIFGTEKGNENLKFLQKLASTAGQYIGDLQEAYRKFAPSAMLAGAKQEEVNQIFEDFTKVSTVLHFSTDQVKSLYLALEQMYAKTTVQSEEIKKQLGNVLPGAVEIGAKAWASYSKSADKSVAAFMKAMEKNLVVTKEFAPAFAKEYEAIFGGKDDSIFLDASTKLLSNINRVRTAARNVSTDLYDITAAAMNEVVKLGANTLDIIQANLQGVVQGIEATAIVIGTSLTIAFTKLALSARGLAVLAAVFNPIVLGTVAAGAAITVLTSKTAGMEVKYGRFTAASKEQIAELMKTYAAQGKGAKQAGEELDRLTEKSNSFSLLYQGMQIEFSSLGSSILSSLGNAISIWWETTINFFKKGFNGLVVLFQDTFGTKVVDIIVSSVGKIKEVFTAIGLTRLGEDFQLGVTTALENIANDAKKTQEEVNKAKQAAKPIVFAGTDTGDATNGTTTDTAKAAAAAKALKDAYKDIARETKLATEETATLLDQLASKYADNLVSIKDYYAKRVQLQLANVEVEKTIQEKMIARASAAGDTATIEKAKDQIELLNEKAKQFQPIADKERTNDLRTYNNTLASTTAQYLELTGATVAATNARLALQNAPLKQQLKTQINDTTSTPAEKTKATEVLGQVTTGEEITKIHAAAEAAKSYRNSINEISQSYMQMGATSADVMNTTLGGFSPMINMISNFQTEQAKVLATMADLQAKSAELAAVKIEILKAPDTEATRAALEQNTKDTELNVKQRDALEAESNMSKVKAITNTFALGENLAEKGSKTQKLLHKATVAMQVVEMAMTIKAGVTYVATKLTEMAASASATGVKMGEAAATLVAESGWAGFAGIAALAAIVAGFAASGGGGSTTTTSTSQPESNPAGTVFGDKTAISTSLEDTLSLLTDINYKSYNELVKMNFYSNKTSSSIMDLNKIIAGGKLMAPSLAQTGTSGTGGKGALIGLAFGVVGAFFGALFDKTITITKLDEGIQTLGNSMKNILTGAKAQVAQYTTLEKTTETLFSTSKSVYDVLQKATTQAVDAFTAIFRNIGNTILNMANKVGETALVALYKYKFSSLKISLMGKQGDDLTKKLTGLVNKELDKVAMAVFGSMFKDLRDLKEGMFATVTRLLIQKEVVQGYFKDLGASFTVNTVEGVKFADALVRVSSNAATGAERLKEFAKQQEDFFNNFATTLMKNNKTVADFAQGLSSVFTQGLSIDQVSKTKAFVDYNKALADLDKALIKSTKLQTLEANLAKAKTPTAIRNAQKKLTPVEDAYNAQVAAAQDTLTKATTNYNVGLNGSIEAYQTLKDIFFNTVATTGDFGAALIEVKKNLDLSTDSGKAAFVMLNNLSNEFNKLVDSIVQPIKNQITSIADSIDATSKEDLLKQLAASRDFESQKTISVKIQKLIVDKYNTEKTAINNIKNSFINLAATVKTLLGGDLSTKNPYEKLQLAQTEYTDLLAKSRSTDLTVAADAASKLGASAQAYLTEAKSYFGATAQYADIFNSVTTTLSGLSQTAESAADASTAQLEALGQAAIDELNNLASISTQAILDTLKEGIKALDITDTTKIATDQLLLLATKADNLGIAFDALIAKFNQEMGTPTGNSGSGIQALMDQLTVARTANVAAKAAKDKTAIQATQLQMKNIDEQIKSYNRGFAKGGVGLAVIYATHMAEIQKDPSLKTIYAGQYADGGVVRKRGMSLVGERGPELIHLPVGTNVIKNSTTNRLLEDSNRETINILSDMKKELIILNDRMGTIERKTRLTKPTLSMA